MLIGRRTNLFLALGALAAATCAQVQAQESTRAGARLLEEVIVTARKREESLQETPVTVTAFTGDAIESLGITTVNDVALRTPGLTYGNFGDQKLSPTSLRGVISSSGSAGRDPAVGFYLDEVFLGQGVGAMIDMVDLESIEVLRGPQGTLFGRNTIAGLIHYRTAAPTDEFEGYVMADYGNFDYNRIGGAVSGPLAGSSVLGRMVFVRNERDGTSRNQLLNRDVNSQQSTTVRGQLLFAFGDDTEWRVTADYREVDQDSLVFETLRYDEGSTFVQVLDAFGFERNPDPFDRRVYADDVTYERSEAWGVMSHFSTTLGDIDLVNITAYREHDYENRTDTDRSGLRWAYDGDPEEVSRFSNELRLSASAGDFDWIAGVYYFEQETSNLSFVELGPDLLSLFGVPGIDSLATGSDASMDTTSAAAFGSLTWNVSEQLAVTLGGRYTWEEKSIDYTQVDPLGLLGGDFSAVADDDWAEFTPSLTAEYTASDDVFVYGTVSNGFKSGGFNDGLGEADGISFDPETLWNYELGLKSTLFDGRAQANIAVFYMDWDDIQVSADNPATPVFDPIIANAGAAHSSGVEVEFLAQPIDALTIGLNVALLEAEYDGGALPDGTPLADIPRAPDYTANFSMEYRAPLGSSIDWFVGGEILSRGESYLTIDNQEDGRVDAYELYNARLGLEASDGRWRVSLWGRNIGDEVVRERLFDLANNDIIGQKFIILNDPETYGVSVRWGF
ncbi:MAG: TonB-dependent receptor [Halieaceae bacterium]|jgi:iron complex outermembrane receptor protein|nr:TonB-dependent receptor [Halieaceae bacterium]